MGIDFRPLSPAERASLGDALRLNAESGGVQALRLNPADTGFAGVMRPDELRDEEVIAAIRSVPCHYADDRAVRAALTLLRESPEYVEDARQGAPLGNSVVGSLLSLPPHSIPRQYAERAVVAALAILDSARAESAEPDQGGNYTLTRTGQAPLRFRGELLAESDGERLTGRDQNRWHELAVYRTAGGKYVVQVSYRTHWQGELDHDTAVIVDAAAEVTATLTDYDVAAHVQGYPAHPSYAERQAQLQADVRRRYEAQVSEILAADPAFAAEVE